MYFADPTVPLTGCAGLGLIQAPSELVPFVEVLHLGAAPLP